MYNARGTFQHRMNIVCLTLNDNLPWFTWMVSSYSAKCPDNRTNTSAKVILQLQYAGATLTLRKYKVFTDVIIYLDYVIRKRLKLASHTMVAIRELKLSTMVSKLQSFFDFCNTFQRFVSNFA